MNPNPKRDNPYIKVLGWLSAVPVALIVALTFVDVIGRYLVSMPVKGSVEIIEYAMALLIFIALPVVTHKRGHVTVSLIDGWLKETGKVWQQRACDLISALALGLLSWRLWIQGQHDLESGGATVVLGLSQAPLIFVLAAFATLTTLTVLAMTFNDTVHKEANP